jgi:hypothetical protein
MCYVDLVAKHTEVIDGSLLSMTIISEGEIISLVMESPE